MSVVDLPQPVGPTTATNSPRSTVMLKSRSAVSDLPVGDTKRRLTLMSSIAGVRLSSCCMVLILTRAFRACTQSPVELQSLLNCRFRNLPENWPEAAF
ncbi:hypothetical protein ACK83U_15285 [Rhizobium sp. WW22]|uniref:hypothetical protein n=1 Tax=Rhizobium sp. WW22 TaxID=3389070 RepID=UPI00399AB077